ncbi:MAG: hypothetical protein HYV93_04440 [Candidatus Rokubacteria bacterium]|nr:hypothetical protein [Candidatus Rokubacteria bacterium]
MIEVRPHLARHTEESIAGARQLWKACSRPNVTIKIRKIKAPIKVKGYTRHASSEAPQERQRAGRRAGDLPTPVPSCRPRRQCREPGQRKSREDER